MDKSVQAYRDDLATDFDRWVVDTFGGDTMDDMRSALEDVSSHGWQAYGIGYGTAGTLLDQYEGEIWGAVGQYAQDHGTTVLGLLNQRHGDIIHSQGAFAECMVGLAAEYIAGYLAACIVDGDADVEPWEEQVMRLAY